ncbi:similar to An08g09690 [Aspergillus luchuensis]|uniref:Similar to An08g09690 n=1 Tax=Aspergillus kawachii TaxID=1069201 RepID=A0A146FZV3_ASPKA|nr:similar to An08g09690 [Aspergillus luchuensis]
MPSRWLAQGEVAPGTIIQLMKAKWLVHEKANEHCFQLNEDDLRDRHDPSFACTRLICEARGPNGPVQGHMRYYKQIPIEGTEAEPSIIRAKQAESFSPPELVYLRTLAQKGSTITPRLLDSREDKQDNTGFVPGGFVIWVVWAVVPGLQLGNDFGSAPFWGLSRKERDAVRQAFKDSIKYYVGFLLTCKANLQAFWSPARWAGWGLARPPRECRNWDRITEGWEL